MDSGLRRAISAKDNLATYCVLFIQRTIHCSNALFKYTNFYEIRKISSNFYIHFQIRFKYYQCNHDGRVPFQSQ